MPDNFTETTPDRGTLRQMLRERRRSLALEQQEQARCALVDILTKLELFVACEHVALYLANDGEICPQRVAEWLWQQGKTCYLPVLDIEKPHFLKFVEYHSTTTLVKNRFGIPEPEPDNAKAISPDALDLVLMPLTGFDTQGERLGMGGGFYDRTFEFTRNAAKPLLIGLAHECQKVEQIPVAEWDVPLAGIATDQGYYDCSSTSEL